jgi:hypothetical protein
MTDRRSEAENLLQKVDCGELLPRFHPLKRAFHEAAHALMSESFGCRVDRMSCQSAPRYGGFVISDGDSVPLAAELAIIIALAGEIATHRLEFSKAFDAKNFNLGLNDALICTTVEKAVCPNQKEPNGLIHSCAVQVHELIQRPETQRWLRALAIDLYVKERMSGDEVREVLRQNGFYEENNFLIQFGLEMRDKTIGEVTLGLLDLSELERVSAED